MGKTRWRTEPGSVEKDLDDLWLGVKFQSNPEIAGSPRNSFRASVEKKLCEGRALNGCGPHLEVPISIKLRMSYNMLSSQTMGDKVHSQKGNSPDRQLRSQNYAKWERRWSRLDN